MRKKDKRKEELYVKKYPKSPVSESFRFIRTNLRYMNPDDETKVIGITSTSEQEGKSTVAANLGIALSLEYDKVIVVDADLRKPKLNQFFGITNASGLSDYLSANIDYPEIIKETKEKNLDIITTGNIPPNPAELLNSHKIEKLLKSLKNDYDKVIIDTAPIIPVSDTVTLSPKLDGVLIIVAANQTDKELLIKTKDILENVNANILGTILNKYPVKSGGYYYQKSYYY
mgnify:CR=1 FL=1